MATTRARKPTTSRTRPAPIEAPDEGAEPVLYVRITREMDTELDSYVEELRAEHPSFTITKAGVIREAVQKLLAARRAAARP